MLFTPNTTVASTSLPPGAEMMTFFAPPARCLPASALVVKKPVDSNTYSAPTEAQSIFDGSRCANTLILSPLTTMESPSTPTVPGNLPCAVSYCVR